MPSFSAASLLACVALLLIMCVASGQAIQSPGAEGSSTFRKLKQTSSLCPSGTTNWPASSPYCWYKRDSGKRREGPGSNLFSSSNQNIIFNADGSLELRVVKTSSKAWTCAEVFLDRSLGYGSYIWRVETNPYTVNRNMVASPGFLYASPVNRLNREADIEYARFGNANAESTQFVLQPDGAVGGMKRINLNASNLTHRMRWSNATGTPADFLFETFGSTGALLLSWSPSGGDYFTAGDERVHMNHWISNTQGIPNAASLTINCFKFCSLGTEASCTSPLGTMPTC